MKEMKTLYKTILAVCAFCFLLPAAFAQNLAPGTYEVTNGIAYNKSVTGPNSDGSYTVKIETFVAGNVTSYNNKPADIILVLDTSSSMAEPKGSTSNLRNLGSISLSYNDIVNGNVDYFVYSGGYYENIFAETTEYNGTTWYRLFFYPRRPTYTDWTTDPDEKLDLGRTVYSGHSRINELKKAVNLFITEIEKNDRLDANNNERLDDEGNKNYLHNQIAIVSFDNTYHNILPFTDVNETSQTKEDMIAKVNALLPNGGTAAKAGLDRAKTLLDGIAGSRPNSSKTLVFFTDGEPDDNAYNQVINSANTIKTAEYTPNIFSVSVFNSDNLSTKREYMNRVSSNYRGATTIRNGTKVSSDFYMDATSDEVSLSDIFKKIAEVSGGSANDKINEGSITALDIVSASFTIPSGTDENKIIIRTEKCTGKSGDYLTFSDSKVAPTRDPIRNYEYFDNASNEYVIIPSFDVDANVHFERDETNNSITVSGFDFVKCFCGHDDRLGYVGYKLVLEFPITVKDDAVGGAGAATNLPGSGIYLKNEDGSRGENLVVFNQPSVNMPTNLWIQKSGLSKGESALFTVQRIPTSYVNKTKVNNVYQYQVTDESKWEDYTTVLITGAVDSEGELLSPMAKLTGLSSDYYYRVIESDTNHHSWSWSYDSNAQTAVETYNIDHNPIRFSNQKNTKSQGKHYAESKAINYFGKAKDQETINSREHFTNKNQSE